MPVIVDAEDFDKWLDGEGAEAEGLLRPYAGSRTLTAYAVDRRVGNVKFDDADLVRPLEDRADEAGPDQPRLV